jgi:hypothetical protein
MTSDFFSPENPCQQSVYRRRGEDLKKSFWKFEKRALTFTAHQANNDALVHSQFSSSRKAEGRAR